MGVTCYVLCFLPLDLFCIKILIEDEEGRSTKKKHEQPKEAKAECYTNKLTLFTMANIYISFSNQFYLSMIVTNSKYPKI